MESGIRNRESGIENWELGISHGLTDRPEEGMVVDAVFPKLFAAIIRIHVEPHHILFSCLLIWPQLNVESPPLKCDLTSVDPIATM